MPKIKTNRGAAKRFRRTGGGGFKCGQSFRRHILTKSQRKEKDNCVARLWYILRMCVWRTA